MYLACCLKCVLRKPQHQTRTGFIRSKSGQKANDLFMNLVQMSVQQVVVLVLLMLSEIWFVSDAYITLS